MMTIQRLPFGALLLAGALALTGCAAGPSAVEIVRPPALSREATAYVLEGSEGGLDAEALAAIDRGLAGWGWRPAARGDTAAHRVTASYSIRPQALGAFAGTERPEDSSGWLAEPVRRRWWRRSRQAHELVLTVRDAEGREVYRAEARQLRPDATSRAASLAELILAAAAAESP